MFFTWLLYLTFLLNSIHGSRHVGKFINDLMELPAVNQCDFGYVYEEANGISALIENTIMKTVNQRYSPVTNMIFFSNLHIIISEYI